MSASKGAKLGRIFQELSQLDSDQYPPVLDKLLSLIKAGSSASGTPPSISSLRGVGKELWSGIDVDEYLRQERNSWK